GTMRPSSVLPTASLALLPYSLRLKLTIKTPHGEAFSKNCGLVAYWPSVIEGYGCKARLYLKRGTDTDGRRTIQRDLLKPGQKLAACGKTANSAKLCLTAGLLSARYGCVQWTAPLSRFRDTLLDWPRDRWMSIPAG